MGGGGGSSYHTVRKRDPDSANITALQNTLYQQFTPMAGQLGADYQAAKDNANKYQSQYDQAYSGLQNLTETGNLPSGLTDAMNGYISREMNRSLGTAMAQNAGKGVLNSSVTNRAINDISTSTADAFAKNYADMFSAASGNYGNLMSGAQAQQGQMYDNLESQYGPMMEFLSLMRQSEDLEDYDTVVEQGGK